MSNFSLVIIDIFSVVELVNLLLNLLLSVFIDLFTNFGLVSLDMSENLLLVLKLPELSCFVLLFVFSKLFNPLKGFHILAMLLQDLVIVLKTFLLLLFNSFRVPFFFCSINFLDSLLLRFSELNQYLSTFYCPQFYYLWNVSVSFIF